MSVKILSDTMFTLLNDKKTAIKNIISSLEDDNKILRKIKNIYLKNLKKTLFRKEDLVKLKNGNLKKIVFKHVDGIPNNIRYIYVITYINNKFVVLFKHINNFLHNDYDDIIELDWDHYENIQRLRGETDSFKEGRITPVLHCPSYNNEIVLFDMVQFHHWNENNDADPGDAGLDWETMTDYEKSEYFGPELNDYLSNVAHIKFDSNDRKYNIIPKMPAQKMYLDEIYYTMVNDNLHRIQKLNNQNPTSTHLFSKIPVETSNLVLDGNWEMFSDEYIDKEDSSFIKLLEIDRHNKVTNNIKSYESTLGLIYNMVTADKIEKENIKEENNKKKLVLKNKKIGSWYNKVSNILSSTSKTKLIKFFSNIEQNRFHTYINSEISKLQNNIIEQDKFISNLSNKEHTESVLNNVNKIKLSNKKFIIDNVMLIGLMLQYCGNPNPDNINESHLAKLKELKKSIRDGSVPTQRTIPTTIQSTIPKTTTKKSSKINKKKNKCTKRNPNPPCVSGYFSKKNKKGIECCYKQKIKKKSKKRKALLISGKYEHNVTDKIWEIEFDGKTLSTTWGKKKNKKRSSSKKATLDIVKKLIKTKIKKGYKLMR